MIPTLHPVICIYIIMHLEYHNCTLNSSFADVDGLGPLTADLEEDIEKRDQAMMDDIVDEEIALKAEERERLSSEQMEVEDTSNVNVGLDVEGDVNMEKDNLEQAREDEVMEVDEREPKDGFSGYEEEQELCSTKSSKKRKIGSSNSKPKESHTSSGNSRTRGKKRQGKEGRGLGDIIDEDFDSYLKEATQQLPQEVKQKLLQVPLQNFLKTLTDLAVDY